jgi:4-hydroxythreonine-4-phosphate dehydrogenase
MPIEKDSTWQQQFRKALGDGGLNAGRIESELSQQLDRVAMLSQLIAHAQREHGFDQAQGLQGFQHRVARTARVVHESLKRDFAIARPRLAMAALNPHAGEGGALGLQEIETLIPVAEHLRGEGIDITDPRPADTLFHDAARATYDAVICMYHDQALIPVKTLDFWGGVNATLGLPIVRTSPDHGTGFDIAGKRIARADSFIAAVRLASEMAAARATR